MPFAGFSVKGPMARSVADTAFLLSVMAGPDPRDPSVYPSDPSAFARPLDRELKGVRVAWCPDLGGLPLDRRVRSVLDGQRKAFEQLGCIVEDACPDLRGADKVFLDLRLWMSWSALGPVLAQHRDQLKPEAIWQIESVAHHRRLTSLGRWSHGEILERTRRFQEKYEFLLCAVNQVPPFDAKLDWPHEIEGVAMENYVSWMKSAYWITVTFRPRRRCPRVHCGTGCPSASRSWAATATTSACSRWPTPSNRRPASERRARRSPSA